MPLILIGALAATLIATHTQQGAIGTVKIPEDAEILNGLGSTDTRTQDAYLHAQLRREKRDDPWAENSEGALRDLYSPIPHLNDTGPLRVICATTLCEVAQTLPGPDQADEQDRTTLVSALQGGMAQDGLPNLGLTYMGSSFKDGGTRPGQTLFVTYWSHWQQPKPDPLLDGKLSEEDVGDRRFYNQVRAEKRDSVWADRTERNVVSLLRALPTLGQGDHRIRVHCAATLCEISAATIDHPNSQQENDFYDELQTSTYNSAIEALGLKQVLIEMGGMTSEPDRQIYIAYYRRNGT